jgi:hypothetical protein
MPDVLRWQPSSLTSKPILDVEAYQRIQHQPSGCILKSRLLRLRLALDLSSAKPQKLTHEIARSADVLVTIGCGRRVLRAGSADG